MWDLHGSGIEPVFPALAGGFLTTAPPGKSLLHLLDQTGVPHVSTVCRVSWVDTNDLNGRSESQVPEFGTLLKLSNRLSSPPDQLQRGNIESQGNLLLSPTSIFWPTFKVRVKCYFTYHIVTFLSILTSGECGCFLYWKTPSLALHILIETKEIKLIFIFLYSVGI